jgi:hypothetical protein
MKRYPLSIALASVVLIAALAAAPARAQWACYSPPVVSYYAPAPVFASPAPQYFAGTSYSYYSPPTVTAGYAGVQTYYRPRPILRPFYYQPGPVYYTPTYSYSPGYSSFYSSPGFFRY